MFNFSDSCEHFTSCVSWCIMSGEKRQELWSEDIFVFENVTYSYWHNIKRRSWHTEEATNTSSEEKAYQMLHNAQTSAERQMEDKGNSQVEEITRKCYNKELQATKTTEGFAETKLTSLGM